MTDHHRDQNMDRGAPDSGAAGRPRGGSRQRRKGTAVGLLILAGAGAVVAGAEAIGVQGASAVLPVKDAAVPAGDYVAICPEPMRLLEGATEGIDPAFSPVSTSAVTSVDGMVFSDLGGTIPGSSLTELGAPAALRTIAEPVPEALRNAAPAGNNDAGLTAELAAVLAGQAVNRETVLRVEPLGLRSSLAGALLSYTAADGDLRGYAAAHCQVPGHEHWLVGASTTVGSTAVLKLTNASRTPSTVDLELFGTQGRIQTAGSRGLLVPPGQTKAIVLAGLAANQTGLTVHASTSGGPVSAVIQQSTLRGLTPGGVDLIQPSTAPGTTQVLAGVNIQAPGLAGPVRDQPGYADAAPELQVAVPGSQDAVLEVRVLGAGGQTELAGGGVVTAAAGSMTSVPLSSLPEGSYTVEIRSDVPVSAAARVVRATAPGQPVDAAWVPSADRLGNQHLVVLPQALSSTLVFGAPAGEAEVQLRPIGPDGVIGAPQMLHVPAGTTVTADPRAYGATAAGLLVSAAGDAVYGSQLFAGPGAEVAVVPLVPVSGGQQSIAVNLGY